MKTDDHGEPGKDFESLAKEVLRDPDARAAAIENSIRRDIAAAIINVRGGRKLSVRSLAVEIGASVSQVRRLLHQEVGGGLTLQTICRAVDRLGLRLFNP